MERRDFLKGGLGIALLSSILPTNLMAKLDKQPTIDNNTFINNPLFIISNAFEEEFFKSDENYWFCEIAYWKKFERAELEEFINKYSSYIKHISNIVIGEEESKATVTSKYYINLGRRLARGIKSTCNLLISNAMTCSPIRFEDYNYNNIYQCIKYNKEYFTHPKQYLYGRNIVETVETESPYPMQFHFNEEYNYKSLSFSGIAAKKYGLETIQKEDVDYAIKNFCGDFDLAVMSPNTYTKVLNRNINLRHLDIRVDNTTAFYRKTFNKVESKPVLTDGSIILWKSDMAKNKDAIRFAYTKSDRMQGFKTPVDALSLVLGNAGRIYMDENYAIWADIAGIPVINPYSYGLIQI